MYTSSLNFVTIKLNIKAIYWGTWKCTVYEHLPFFSSPCQWECELLPSLGVRLLLTLYGGEMAFYLSFCMWVFVTACFWKVFSYLNGMSKCRGQTFQCEIITEKFIIGVKICTKYLQSHIFQNVTNCYSNKNAVDWTGCQGYSCSSVNIVSYKIHNKN